jgi:hypothetical protein
MALPSGFHDVCSGANDLSLTVAFQAEALRHSSLFKPHKMSLATFMVSDWPSFDCKEPDCHGPLTTLTAQPTPKLTILQPAQGTRALHSSGLVEGQVYVGLAGHFVIYPSTLQNGQFPIPWNPWNTGIFRYFYVQFGRRVTHKLWKKWWVFYWSNWSFQLSFAPPKVCKQ